MNDTVKSAQTQENATGVEAKTTIGRYYIFYDPHGRRYVVVNEPLYTSIFNEDNYLNAAIEEMHAANKRLTDARNACLQEIDKAKNPTQVNPSTYQQLVAEFDAAQDLANEKRKVMDNIHKSLNDLQDPVVKPIHTVSTIKELIPVGGIIGEESSAKVRYVRPAVAFPERNGMGSMEWSEIEITESESKSFLINGKFDADKFQALARETFSKPDIKSKIERDLSAKLLPEKMRMQSGFLTNFAENWSKAAQYSTDKNLDADTSLSEEERMSNIFSFDAAAQFLRYTHGVGIKGDFDLRSLKGSIKAEGIAELALLEGKADFIWQIPDRRGWMLSLPARDGRDADLGLVRLVFKILLKGFVGASLAGELSVTVDTSGYIKGENAFYRNPAPQPMGNRFKFDEWSQSSGSPSSTVNAGGGIGGFAGAEGTGEFDMAIEWKNPEAANKYAAFARYVIGASIQGGIGANAKFSIGYQEGLGFYIEASAGLCWGVGAKGNMKLTINAMLMGEFLLWFAYQLRNVDFRYIRDLINDRNFRILCQLQFLLIAGTYVMEGLQPVLIGISDLVTKYREYSDRVRLMERILDDAEGKIPGQHRAAQIKYATPEVKGNILWMLTDTNYWDHHFGVAVQNNNPLDGETWLLGNMKRLKRAVLTVLKYTQSQSEYRNIMQHMSMMMGGKGNWQENEKRLLNFLDYGELNHWLFQWAFTDYDGDFKSWLATLPPLSQEEVQRSLHDGINHFYESLPAHTSPGVCIDDSLITNGRYGCYNNFQPPSHTAAEFSNCCAPNVWEETQEKLRNGDYKGEASD